MTSYADNAILDAAVAGHKAVTLKFGHANPELIEALASSLRTRGYALDEEATLLNPSIIKVRGLKNSAVARSFSETRWKLHKKGNHGMSVRHDCRALLCDTPHYANDRHAGDCLCKLCHSHDEGAWNMYPECAGCLRSLAQWIHENTNFIGCPIPEYCDYSPHCDEQYQLEHYGQIVRPQKKVANG
jgi:hypothetical protein